MKKIILGFVLLTIILSGCSKSGYSQAEIFEKKQECAKYIDYIFKEEELTSLYTTYDWWWTAQLQGPFFSETLNTCFYWIIRTYSTNIPKKYYIVNILNNEKLYDWFTSDNDIEYKKLLNRWKTE